MTSNKHIFSLYSPTLFNDQRLSVGSILSLHDADLAHRIHTVLRLKNGEFCEIFNAPLAVGISLITTKNNDIVSGRIAYIKEADTLKPIINLFIGILKPDAFEYCVYIAAQMGVASITPLITEKVHRNNLDNKTKIRLEKVMIAACEQSKQIFKPILQNPVAFETAVLGIDDDSGQKTTADLSNKSFSFYCDPEGQPFFDCLQTLKNDHFKKINIFIGPEAGFSNDEQKLFVKQKIGSYKLTQSILRTQEAVSVCVGAVRSVFN